MPILNLVEQFDTQSFATEQETLDAMTDSELITLLQGNNDITSVHNILDTIAYSAEEVVYS